MTALSLLVAGAVACGGGPGPRADVVLVTVDTLRGDHLSAYGYPRATSPSIDALARGSVTFTRAYALAPATGPALASLMTGLSPVDTTVASNRDGLPGELPTLAETLRAAGYRTRAVVSNVILVRDSGFARGFDGYDDAYTTRESNRVIVERSARETAAAAIDAWRAPGSGPLFLWVHFNDPHGPYQDSPRFTGERPVMAAPPSLPRDTGESGLGAIPAYQWREGEADPLAYVDRYDGEISAVDGALARLLGELRRDAARFDRTLLALTADHGEAMGEHGHWFAHGHACHEALLSVPLIVKPPAGHGLAGPLRDDVAAHVDLLPTVQDVLGLPASPAPSRGRTLRLPVGPRDVVAVAGPGESADPHVALVRPPHKLLRGGDGVTRLLRVTPLGEVEASEPGVARDLARALDAAAVPLVTPQPVRRSLEEEQLREMRRLGYLQ